MKEMTKEDIIQRQCLEEILQIILDYYRNGGTMEAIQEGKPTKTGSAAK